LKTRSLSSYFIFTVNASLILSFQIQIYLPQKPLALLNFSNSDMDFLDNIVTLPVFSPLVPKLISLNARLRRFKIPYSDTNREQIAAKRNIENIYVIFIVYSLASFVT
jgi:hypothetical protein